MDSRAVNKALSFNKLLAERVRTCTMWPPLNRWPFNYLAAPSWSTSIPIQSDPIAGTKNLHLD